MVSEADAPSEKARVSIGSILQSPFVMGGLGVVVSLLIAGFAARYLSNPDAVVVRPHERADLSVLPMSPSSVDTANPLSKGGNPGHPAMKGNTMAAGKPSNIAMVGNHLVSTAELPSDSIPWAFGVIVLGCVGGCLLVTRQLNQAVTQSQSIPRTLSRSHPGSKRSQMGRQPLQATNFTIVESSGDNLAFPSSSFRSTQSLSSSRKPASLPPGKTTHLLNTDRQAAQSMQPLVTVLPSTAVHPLDWGEDSLANQLDIRKRHSASHSQVLGNR